jgi:hypothetical protein
MQSVADDLPIKLTRDEALVLSDYLHRWQQTDDSMFADDAERIALWNLLAVLESADDGVAFRSDYPESLEAARSRLRQA